MIALVCFVASAALAQPAGERAQAHFERGLAQYDGGFYDAALAEFDAAYALDPNPAILYNLGRVHAQLGHWVRAASAYEQYLASDEREIRRRRREVERLLAEARGRIGLLRVETNVEGAVVMIGGVDRATTPLDAPIRVDAGRVEVGARATGHDTAREEVTIAGGEERTVRLELRPLMERRGSIRVRSLLEDVEVLVDGAFLGRTPIDDPQLVSLGPHVVEGRRPGYRSARVETTVVDRGEHTVVLELEVDETAPDSEFGALALATPHPPSALEIDRRAIEHDPELRLPIGRHRLRIEVPERAELEVEIEIASGEVLALAPAFRWTDAARAERRSSASAQRLLGWVLGAAGLGLTAAGVIGLALAGSLADDELLAMIRFCEDPTNAGSLACSPDGGFDLQRAIEEHNASVDNANLARLGSFIGLGAGLAALGTGVVLFLLSPSDDAIDREASEREATLELRFAPNGASLSGAF